MESLFFPSVSFQGAAPFSHAFVPISIATARFVCRIFCGIVNVLALIRWPVGPHLAVALKASSVRTPPGGFDIDGCGKGGDQGDDGDFREHFV